MPPDPWGRVALLRHWPSQRLREGRETGRPSGSICRGTEALISLPIAQLAAAMLNTEHQCHQVDAKDTIGEVEAFIEEAIWNTDGNFQIAEALEWADGWKWPQAVIDADHERFIAAKGDFPTMVAQVQAKKAPSRLSTEHVLGLRTDNPEIEKLLVIAKGMPVPKPKYFVPNRTMGDGKPAASYMKAAEAVDRMLSEIQAEEQGFILRNEVARDIVNLHYGKHSWTEKKDTKSGRGVTNMTHCMGMSLNKKETKAEAERVWGSIVHPTISDMIALIWAFWVEIQIAEPGTVWEDLVMWNMDLKDAYTLLSVSPESAALFALQLRDGLTFIQFCGCFGWAPIPFIFQVVTKAVKWEMSFKLKGKSTIYVDDAWGITLKKWLQHDLNAVTDICTGLLGPHAIAEKKTMSGTSMNIIGWHLDLTKMRLTIARKNLLNTFYAFFTIDTKAKVGLRVMQKLASLASRYTLTCPSMAPFTGALNKMIAGWKRDHAVIGLSVEAEISISMWRAMFYLMSQHEKRLAKALQTFLPTPLRMGLEMGGLLYRTDAGDEIVLGGYAVDLIPLGFGVDSSFQNTSEFIGIILGVIALVLAGARDIDLEVSGDSM
jgi:hypothetical protein